MGFYLFKNRAYPTTLEMEYPNPKLFYRYLCKSAFQNS